MLDPDSYEYRAIEKILTAVDIDPEWPPEPEVWEWEGKEAGARGVILFRNAELSPGTYWSLLLETPREFWTGMIEAGQARVRYLVAWRTSQPAAGAIDFIDRFTPGNMKQVRGIPQTVRLLALLLLVRFWERLEESIRKESGGHTT